MATARELAARGWRPLRRGLHRTQDRLNGGRGIPVRAAPGWTVRTPPEAWEELRYWLRYEAATFALIRRIWRGGMTVLDVGAHHGLFSLCCCRAEAMPGRVVTVEPSPRALPLLRRARALYPGLNWTVVEAAVGERVGRLRMAAGMEQMLVVDAALHAEGRAAPGAVPVPAVEVQVARLDEMARELMLWPDLIKVRAMKLRRCAGPPGCSRRRRARGSPGSCWSGTAKCCGSAASIRWRRWSRWPPAAKLSSPTSNPKCARSSLPRSPASRATRSAVCSAGHAWTDAQTFAHLRQSGRYSAKTCTIGGSPIAPNRSISMTWCLGELTAKPIGAGNGR